MFFELHQPAAIRWSWYPMAAGVVSTVGMAGLNLDPLFRGSIKGADHVGLPAS